MTTRSPVGGSLPSVATEMKPEDEMGVRWRLFSGDYGYTAAAGEKLCIVEPGPADLRRYRRKR
ncbi:unnamed protein product [Arabis nemorensis]|uniref:Uncharacterized protein n=1 Tax=Arabis nemorensis TaxID=586526 RepID=A0A565CNB3_9BRAS|nr:unnamed protein product [Arabis nemorensis]